MKDNNTIYFTSNRDGSSDIFRAKLVRDKLSAPLTVHITVINSKTGKPTPAEITWADAYKSEKPGFFRSKDGICRYLFVDNKPVVFKAINRDMVSEEIIIDPQDLISAQKKETQITLILHPEAMMKPKTPFVAERESIETDYRLDIEDLNTNDKVVLHNIYFEQSKPDVRPESYPEIQRLANVLKANPHMSISIAGHTDNVGDKLALMKLSENRALAIKKLLFLRGIPNHRVTALGYGDSRPIAPNDTEDNKRKNRRVEIKVVSR
jgi:outer membrane protein OmpA-like peptidoglycan-associated protein